MTFIQSTDILMRKSDKSISKIFFKNGVNVVTFDPDFKPIYSSNIININQKYSGIWFDLDEEDNIYGIFDDKNGRLIKIDINDDKINKYKLIDYDISKYVIKFPHIKKVKRDIHLIYYLKDYQEGIYKLAHCIKREGHDISFIVDIVGYDDISNFIIESDNSNLSVFYFKIVNGYEEVFISTFNYEKSIWYKPIQITNSGKEKLHLSVTKGSNNTYHIAFSEDNSGKYQPTYKSIELNKENISIKERSHIKKSSACNMPHIIEYENAIYMQWVEYDNLNTSKSDDFGKSWSEPTIDENSVEYPFIRYYYKSNYELDKPYKVSFVYGCRDYINILGI